ncbi:MAG: hypothetical protein BGP06_09820 [Rhizobiales bacterium 65-9]|nr:OB-fold domain-containing protein [Hyphomicrobiales bacterium]OJY33198.1 MAG: hypothetical protein BGP06_09820 [Rhizobiales bacterium 65-9]
MSDIVKTFQSGLADGKLLIQSCNACKNKMLYPRHRCTKCHANDLGWVEASGKGTLHSYTVVRAIPPAGFEGELPYGLGIVKLEEGVQLMARLKPGASGDWSQYACDAAVAFARPSPGPGDDRAVAWFKLA